MRYRGIRKRFAVLFVVVTVVLLVLNVIWREYVQREQAEREMLESVQVLATEMDAIWDFMERSQPQFVRNEDGTYNLYCVVAAKAVAKIFTYKSGSFTIHYTNLTTRKTEDAPDGFESRAMEALLADSGLESYYGLVRQDDGSQVFRYIEPLYFKESCLECHGEPAGELDIMGYPKEGKQVDDLAGAASIIMPADTYLDNVSTNIIQETAIFSLFVIAGLAAIFWSVSRVATAQMRRLEEENRQKSDFLAMVSHEIRTPLTSILAFSDIWAASNKPRNDDEAKIMREMRLHSQTLLSMVNNMLELARIEAGRMRLSREPVDLAELLGTVRSSLMYLAQRKRVTISCSVERDVSVVMADGEKLRRILENLVSNAIKFVQGGGQVEVTASYDHRAGRLVLRVSDDGCGIDKNDIANIFDRFVQGGATQGGAEEGPATQGGATQGGESQGGAEQGGATQGGAQREKVEQRGSGLGLALVKELVELHGGTITVESEPKQGSTFEVVVEAPIITMEEV
ncbi:MAG: DUF3365 domain-containing protein [Coriobacteriaceae bacterium]|nr:DUF3365 domain-containing protein [Coriobacteriaceae bacterium]